MTQRLSIFYCPICKKKTARDSSNFPFCSERCRILDLSRWADGSYGIAGDAAVIPDEEVN